MIGWLFVLCFFVLDHSGVEFAGKMTPYENIGDAVGAEIAL